MLFLMILKGKGIDAVFVTGDITASAIIGEFQKAREILDALSIPWWILIGKHFLDNCLFAYLQYVERPVVGNVVVHFLIRYRQSRHLAVHPHGQREFQPDRHARGRLLLRASIRRYSSWHRPAAAPAAAAAAAAAGNGKGEGEGEGEDAAVDLRHHLPLAHSDLREHGLWVPLLVPQLLRHLPHLRQGLQGAFSGLVLPKSRAA
jgi:hypothetical protein